MLFNSFEFLIFLPIVVILYWCLPHKFRWIMLLAASYYFYITWNLNLIVLIGFTTLTSYGSALIIEKSENSKIRKAALAISISASLAVLFFFKYFNFFADSVVATVRAFGIPMNDVALNVLLPVGISFYTFQTFSYSIDVYRRQIKAERHLGYYALFVVFFPQLVAGPIERPDNLIPQLKEKRTFDAENMKLGFQYIVMGFFKKLVVADFLATFVNAVYNNPTQANGMTATIATVLFAVQILCDFDGYTNIAIGVGKLMNINLMKNFNNPYSALSIKDFWSRWHISLSSWFRDYLYIPLGGNRVKKWRYLLNIFIVFLVSGLWHGANWTFVIWGGLNGIYQIIGYFKQKPSARLRSKLGIKDDNSLFLFYQRAVTFSLVCFAWVFFRANTVSDAFLLVGKIFSDWSFSVDSITKSFESMSMSGVSAVATVLAIVSLVCVSKTFTDNKQETIPLKQSVSSMAVQGALNVLLLTTVVIAWIYIIALNGGENSFIYFQF